MAFLISGRVQILRPVAHTKSEKTHTPHNKKQGKTGIFFAKIGHFDQNSHNLH